MTVKRRWLAYVGFFALVALGLFFLFRPPGGEVRDRTWERIERQGVLRVGIDASYPPFELWDEVGLRGYDVDLALALGREWGLEVDFENITFDGLYDALKVERVDIIISALPYDPLLTQDVAYSYSYFDAGQVLVVREDVTIARVEDLKGQRVGLELGSRGDLEARRLEQRMILERKAYLSPQEVLEALRDEKVDAAIVDAVSAYQFMGEEGGLRIVQQVSEEPYVMAVPTKAPILLEKVNEVIVKWRERGFLEELREKWF